MARHETKAQKDTIGRVMHEYKHGELESAGGRKVKSRKQAVAIALSEAGASKQKTPSQNRRAEKHTRAKEAKGRTAMQEKEGRNAKTRGDLYEEAKKRDIPGRSKMSRDQLERALHHH
jgi:hypothetical protein